MARTTHVKHARKLYHTKPVLNEDGTPKRTLVTNKDGSPKTDKRGREVYHSVTERDLDRPKPNLRCDFPSCDIDGGEILPGTAYKFKALRFKQISRHEAHPDWQLWEYSSSVSAQAARLQADMQAAIDGAEFTEEDDFDALRDDLVEMVQGFVEERQEALENMPEQLQDGSQAQEFLEAAEAWLSEVENASEPSVDFAEQCEDCDGTGEVQVDNPDYDPSDPESSEDEYVEDTCMNCSGEGHFDGPSDEWVEEAEGSLSDAVAACEL
jgi:hypothetical protein